MKLGYLWVCFVEIKWILLIVCMKKMMLLWPIIPKLCKHVFCVHEFDVVNVFAMLCLRLVVLVCLLLVSRKCCFCNLRCWGWVSYWFMWLGLMILWFESVVLRILNVRLSFFWICILDLVNLCLANAELKCILWLCVWAYSFVRCVCVIRSVIFGCCVDGG